MLYNIVWYRNMLSVSVYYCEFSTDSNILSKTKTAAVNQ